jgi:hypothetical protein
MKRPGPCALRACAVIGRYGGLLHNMNFPVRKAFVLDRSLFIDAGPYGEIAVAPEHYHFFSGIDLRDLAKRDHCD